MKETKKFMLWWYQINLYFFYQHLSIVGIYASTPIIGIKNQQQQQNQQQNQQAKQDDEEEEEEKTRRKHSYVLYSIVFITVASSYLFNCHHFKNESDE